MKLISPGDIRANDVISLTKGVASLFQEVPVDEQPIGSWPLHRNPDKDPDLEGWARSLIRVAVVGPNTPMFVVGVYGFDMGEKLFKVLAPNGGLLFLGLAVGKGENQHSFAIERLNVNA